MTEHDLPALSGYALDALDLDEAGAVDEHLAGCADCRAKLTMLHLARDWLGEVPPEAFLTGPPDGGDILLQRTLRQVRAATAADPVQVPRRRRLLAAAGVAALAFSTATGVVIGRQTAPEARVAASPTSNPSPGITPSPERVLTGTNPATGASMRVTLSPAAGWVRIHAQVNGLPAGTRCEIVVHSRRGASVVAGSWLVSAAGAKTGTALDGSALVAPADATSVSVMTLNGRQLVTASS